MSNNLNIHNMGYRYDSLNRLTSAADYANSCYFSETYGYDSNGNILTLTRSYDDNIVQDMVTMLDGNRLTGVNDASYDDLLGEFPQIESGSYPDAMDYDAMGNLTRDDTRHISSITYHPVINMPQRLTFDNGSTITWGYRQDGLKYSSNERAKRLSVITTVNAAGDTITRTRVSYDSHTQRYIGDFVRIGNNRWRVYHESGHADILTLASGDSTVYRYYVRDYLGSTRAVLAEDGTLLQDANYYPGGLSFSQLNDTEETDRLHCGKEWVDMEGLGWYGNTARFHDAILCRFTTPDPLAEQYPDLSPYSHCANNPLTIVDPSGMLIRNYDTKDVFYQKYKDATPVEFYNGNGYETEFVLVEIGLIYTSKGRAIAVFKNASGIPIWDDNCHWYSFGRNDNGEFVGQSYWIAEDVTKIIEDDYSKVDINNAQPGDVIVFSGSSEGEKNHHSMVIDFIEAYDSKNPKTLEERINVIGNNGPQKGIKNTLSLEKRDDTYKIYRKTEEDVYY